MAGKTSTAQKLVNGQYAKKSLSAFIGFAPLSDPRIIVAVMRDEPTVGGNFGGKVAALVFAGVMQNALRTLSVAPDAAITAPAEPIGESL